ncbi:hypothetical protein DFH08DRAFT_1073963 [Mycena albidolilacea]|uniref:Uncharacterized protein n=1 Tax=Mycena albidolilacea TaxID=1033008 RepID=A0AAD7AJI9_9AGAR|nr:hypothetical protein DFH08DRAFT_1073963 [Mycena albidolilacea]
MTPGDLGVMIPGEEARRPRFQKIANVAEKISEWAADRPVSTTFERPEQHYVPSADGCWGSEAVDASTIRHTLRLGDTPSAVSMFGYFRARKISFLGNSFDYKASWSYLRRLHETGELLALATKHNVHPSDLVLIFSTSESKGYTHLLLQTAGRRETLLNEVGAKDGVLYYFENFAAAQGELNGYWSAINSPGNPLFGASPLAPGTEWGWEYFEDGLKVEIGR